jgi:hypothetical protein
MPQRNSSRRILVRLVLFTLAGWLLWALGRNTEPEHATTAIETPEPARTRGKAGGFSRRRLATTLAFTTLFFAGAAFSAGAGNELVGALEGDSSACVTDTTAQDGSVSDQSCEASSTEEAATDEGTSSDESPEAAPAPGTTDDGQSGDVAGDDDSGGNADDQSGDDQSGDDQSGGDQGDQSGDQGDQSGDQGSGSGDSNGSTPDPVLGDGSDDGSGGADQSDEPDAGPGSPAHAGDDQGSESGSDVGLTSADNAAKDLEFDDAGFGVVWLHRTLPDPTPPAARLDPRFARLLVRTSSANHVDWALVLGVIRGDGHKSSWPASARQLRFLSSHLHTLRANADAWRAVLALSGRSGLADRAVALSNYNHAVGLRGLVHGLTAETPALERRVLNDRRLSIYPGGRDDVVNHRINVRILVLMEYMAETFHSATVSALDSGHRLYARPGVISAHKYGLAVDIAALGGTSILGHQQAGGITEKAVRSILLLPVELRPKQVISLIGLGGPSFPLADHYDHIHVGY